MAKYQRILRPACRSAVRRATRYAIRTRWSTTDDLGTALACLQRAIRAHRRLARLAPRFFDSTVIERERRDHEADRQWMELCNAALLKVYGTAPRPLPPFPDLPPMPALHTRLAVERELASCRAWLALGGDALRRFQARHPHVCISLSRLARLVDIASALGRLATGADFAKPQTEPTPYSNAWADLKRIYGAPRPELEKEPSVEMRFHRSERMVEPRGLEPLIS